MTQNRAIFLIVLALGVFSSYPLWGPEPPPRPAPPPRSSDPRPSLTAEPRGPNGRPVGLPNKKPNKKLAPPEGTGAISADLLGLALRLGGIPCDVPTRPYQQDRGTTAEVWNVTCGARQYVVLLPDNQSEPSRVWTCREIKELLDVNCYEPSPAAARTLKNR